MRIVSVLTTASLGGAEFAAVEMLDALGARGHEVVMLSDQPAIGRDTRVRVAPVELGPKLSTRTYATLGLRAPLLLRRLRGALEAQAPYDVLLVHYKKEQLLAALLPDRLRPTLAWAEWGPVPFPMRRGPGGRAYRAAARRADLVMAVSEGTRRNVVDVGVAADKVHHVPNVVRADEIDFTPEGRRRVRTALGIGDDAVVVGLLSRLHPKKRNDVLIEAMRRIGDPRAHLLVAGEGEAEAQLRRMAEPLGERAHFVPPPWGERLPEVLSAFDVSVTCPSPTEGAPLAVIFAMLARRPTLSSAPEGVADMIRPEFGAIAEPENDPDALAALLRRYLDDGELRRRAGEAARAWAEATHAAPVVGERIERLLVGAGAGTMAP